MKIDDLLHRGSEWLNSKGPRSECVISSRVRLARNIEKMPFFNRANPPAKKRIMEIARACVEKSKILKAASFIPMKSVTDLDRKFLVERHLMSPEHMADPEFKAVVLDENEVVSIMVNEEDHFRLQVLQSGFNMQNAWKLADEIDTELSGMVSFAFSQKWGYLTACPTNVGTGLRGSVMLHLPALAMTGQLGRVFQAILKLGLTMRGLYGEGTEATGDFFQISNQVTLGHSEPDLIGNIEAVINKVIMRETSTRGMLLEKNREELTDKIWRALGTLKNARIMSSTETITLLSTVRLGVDVGVIKDIPLGTVNELFMLMQPAHLQKLSGKILSPQDRDQMRAALIRDKIK
ncbi:MAG: protein arginine kinase [Candidatus Omnitrophota bacterium]